MESSTSRLKFRLIGLFLSLLIFPARETYAQNPLLLSVNFDKSIPLGPFKKNDTVQIVGTATNTSGTQTIVLCEWICIGDALTYSLGAEASATSGYILRFGNGGPTALGFLNGQLAGPLLPGQSKDFIVGAYSPTAKAAVGTYAFAVQFQIFAATTERAMIGSSTFSGTWQVVKSNKP